jgi:hypothetical protein
MVVHGQLEMTGLFTHRSELGDVLDAYDTFARQADSGALKVLLARRGHRPTSTSHRRPVGAGGRSLRPGVDLGPVPVVAVPVADQPEHHVTRQSPVVAPDRARERAVVPPADDGARLRHRRLVLQSWPQPPGHPRLQGAAVVPGQRDAEQPHRSPSQRRGVPAQVLRTLGQPVPGVDGAPQDRGVVRRGPRSSAVPPHGGRPRRASYRTSPRPHGWRRAPWHIRPARPPGTSGRRQLRTSPPCRRPRRAPALRTPAPRAPSSSCARSSA